MSEDWMEEPIEHNRKVRSVQNRRFPSGLPVILALIFGGTILIWPCVRLW